MDVYSSFGGFHSFQRKIGKDELLVKFTNDNFKSRLTRSRDYQVAFGTRKARSAFGILREIIRSWSGLGRISGIIPVEKVSLRWEHRFPQQGANSKQKRQAFRKCLLFELPDNAHPTQIPELDHHEVVYELVAESLGIDADMCAAHALRLYIAAESPEFMGLMKPNLPDDPDRFMTVRMSSREPNLDLFYECMLSGDFVDISPTNSKIVPVLKVVGVWAPTDRYHASNSMCGAQLLDGGADMDDVDAVLA